MVAWPSSPAVAPGRRATPSGTDQAAGDRDESIAYFLDLLTSNGKSAADVIEAGKLAQSDPGIASDAELRSLALTVICRGYYRSADLAAAQLSCDEARASASSPLSRFAAVRMQATLIAERGHPAEAIPLFLESLALAERSGNSFAMAAALGNLGAVAQFSGANAEAIDYYDKAMAIAARIGATGLEATYGSNLGYLLVENGKADLAHDSFQRALKAAVTANARQAEFTSRNGLAHVKLAAGQPAEAAAELRRLMAAPTIVADPNQLAEAKLFLARAELAAGETARAELSANAAVEGLAQRSPLRAYPAYPVLIDALVANGKLAEAEALSTRVMAIVPETARGRLELLKSRAKLLARRNRHRQAYALLLDAERIGQAQSIARAEDRIAFMRARNEALVRQRELTELRAQQLVDASRASRDRLMRNFSLALAAIAIVGAMVYWVLVRAQRRLETQLLQRRQLDALGKLTGGVAHDFNNLMTVVRQAMGLLRQSPLLHQAPDMVSLVNEADEAARVGGEITQQLLAYARQKLMQPEVVLVPDLVEQRRPLLERTLGESMTLRVHSDPDIGPVRVDLGQLTTALINLLANARDAMDARGVVEVGITEVAGDDCDARLSDSRADRYVAICVSDTGRGMAPHLVRDAVTPFFSTKADSGGSGLGLSMVDGFVNQSGGVLQIDSSEGLGTKVTMLLPRIRAVSPG